MSPRATRTIRRANAEAFTNGWFRTGDQGMIDAEGYLTLTGRLKEIINRGGENISPREVDEALMDHPAVVQVVTFAMPHDKLGEDVAAAVVLREGANCDRERTARLSVEPARRLQDAAQNRLPCRIPKGATANCSASASPKSSGSPESKAKRDAIADDFNQNMLQRDQSVRFLMDQMIPSGRKAR